MRSISQLTKVIPGACLVLFLSIASAHGKTQGSCVIPTIKITSVAGQVISKHEGVSRVTLQLRDWEDQTKTLMEGLTDDDGNFDFTNVKAGKYLLVVKRELYSSLYIPVSVQPGSKTKAKKFLVHLAPDYRDACSEGGVELKDAADGESGSGSAKESFQRAESYRAAGEPRAEQDARPVRQAVNVTVNGSWLLDTNPKSDPNLMGGAVLLDRPDEFLAGVGFDFPINQPFNFVSAPRPTFVPSNETGFFIDERLETRSGFKVFTSRWWILGSAYRRHADRHGLGTLEMDWPAVAKSDDDANDFLFTIWGGHRNPPVGSPRLNRPPTVSVWSSTPNITLPNSPCESGKPRP